MSNNEKNSEINDDYVKLYIKRIKDLYESEIFLNEKILNKGVYKKESFVLFDKDWLEKWKNIVDYETLKLKCKNFDEKKSKDLIEEVRSLIIENNIKEKLEKLGKMDLSSFQRKIGKNKILINEKSNFIPILSIHSAYFTNSMISQITINSEISNGIIYIYDQFPEKDKERKLILLYRNPENEQEFIKPVITLEPKANIQNVLKELKKKKIDEILNEKGYDIKIIKPEEKKKKEEEEEKKRKEEEEKKRKEEEKKRKEEEEKKRKEEENKRIEEEKKKRKEEEKRIEELEKKKQEEERKRKEEEKTKQEEEERKRKEEERKKQEEEERKRKEEERKKQEEEERKRKEEEKRRQEEEERKRKEEEKRRQEEEERKRKEEEKRRQEEEERKRKEEEKRKQEEEKKKKELEEKKKKEKAEKKEKEKNLQQEIEKRKKKQAEDIKKEIEQKNKESKERDRNVNKQYNNNLQNILCDAMKKKISFEEKIKQNGNKKDENFKLECKIIQKKYLNNFENIFNPIKEEIKKNPNNAEQIFQDAINNSTIKFNELENLVPKKPEELIPQALVSIEELAFVDDEFAAKIMSLSLNPNTNNQNNQINNNQVSPMPQIPKANILIHNGAGVIQPQGNNNIFIMNFQNDNINKPDNIQVLDLKNAKDNIFDKIPIKSDKGLIEQVKGEYIKINNPKKIEKPKPPEPKPIIKKPRITLDGRDCSLGLDNVGATCYMNATLQCLAHLKRITEHIINYREDGKVKDEKKYRLCEAYSEVVCSIWLPKDKTKKSFAPDRFKRILGDMNSLFAPTAANDAKDLLIYFIEQMHSELNVTSETNLNLIMPDDMNPMDHQQVLKCFVEEFMKKYNSVFSHYCYGSNVSVTNCNGCGVQKFSYQCFSFIIFPLLEAKKNCVLEGRLNPMFYNSYILNIEDCFKYNQKIELFNGNNQMYCNICQGSRDSWMQTRISSAPLVLILIINRGKGNLDFREPFIFWETIDLTNYVEFPQPDNKYFLAGVVSHMGDSGPSGHFIAFCRMSESQKWYCYNDSLVTESSFQDINSRGFPYILFYQKSQM